MTGVREFTVDDIESVRSLLARNEMEFKNKSAEEWHHLWEDNPLIADGKISWPMGWVLENDEKEIVGFIGNIPILYEFKGKRLVAASASSWVVEAPYRNWSIPLLGAFLNQSRVDLLLDVTANDSAEKVLLAFKAKKAPIESYETSFFWIINHRKFVLSALKKSSSLFSSFITFPLSSAIAATDRLMGKNFLSQKCSGEFECIDSFDERFDTFWEALKSRYDRLLCMRDRRWLDWHFKYAVINKKIWTFIKESDSGIKSYAIFLRQDNPKIGLKRVRLVDFQTVADDPSILQAFISCAFKRCLDEDVHVLESVGFDSRKTGILEGLSPHKRRLKNWHFLYKALGGGIAKELEDIRFWDPSLFDGDASL